MKTKTTLVTLVLALAAASTAAAQTASPTVEQARMLFSAGAKAYDAGQFNAAIQAFEDANKLVAKPQIVFSIAQAHRRQYYLFKEPDHLREAIRRYREYIEAVKEGGRVSDAAQALAELEPIAARTSMDAPAKTQPKDPARIMVMTQVDDVSVTIDGAPAKAGLAVEVTPGKHHVVASAAGYATAEKDVQAVDNALVPVDVPLREKPAHVTVSTLAGAQVSIDGRPAGVTPLVTPIDVPAGTHLVTVTKNGHLAFSREFELGRDERKNVAAPLPPTTQRTVSYGLLIGGGAAIVAGGVFTGIALANQGDAQKVQDARSSGSILPSDVRAYDAARSRRDDWTKAATVTFAVGGVAALTGLALYFFDAPDVTAPPRLDERPKAPEPRPKPREPMEMSFAPLVGPVNGAAVSGTF